LRRGFLIAEKQDSEVLKGVERNSPTSAKGGEIWGTKALSVN
jgi:hypothetical protein